MSDPVIIGNAELWLGDCRDILPTLPKVDAVITDPPYEIQCKFGTSDMHGTRRMQFHFDYAGVTEACVMPAMKMALDRCESFHCFLNPEQFGELSLIARSAGFTAKPFVKIKAVSPPPMQGNWWPSGFELAMYGYRPGAWFGDTNARRVNIIRADSYRHGIRSAEKVDHPTQKWLPMVEYIARSIVPPHGTALDPFMGSGTTGVACMNLGRSFIGIERERKYFDIACERIEDAQRQQRMFT